MYVANRRGLRNETKQIAGNCVPITNDKRRISKFVDKHRMVQLAHITAIPEIRQVVDNAVVVPLGAGRNLWR